MEHTVFTVPCNRPWILTGKDAEEFLKNFPKRTAPITEEERAEINAKVEKLFKKPEKKQSE